MATHIIGLHPPATMRLRRAIPFRATTRRRARVTAMAASSDEARREASLVRCQRRAPPRTGIDCQACPRFLGWAEAPDGLRVECAWSDRDRVHDCMTIAAALIVTRPQASCREAAELARRHGVRRLLVVDGLRLVGVVSRRDLDGGGRVLDRMSCEIFAVLGSATLGEALAAMIALGVGMLPVIGERFVIGVLTRGDLRRVGVPREWLQRRLTLSAAATVATGPREDAAPSAAESDSDLIVLDDESLD